MRLDYIKEKLLFLQDKLNKLKSEAPVGLFLNPIINKDEVDNIEMTKGIKLPPDYKTFIMEIGNGCTGPEYGLLPLQESMIDFKLNTKPQINLSIPFSYSENWNEDWIFDIDWENGERPDDVLLDNYMNTTHISGCLQICHIGHGCTYLLVVNGCEYGNIWTDDRADYGGINPLLNKEGMKVTFIDWYINWLNEKTGSPPT